MTHAEKIIISFLSKNPKAWFSKKEIARHAVRREEYEQNPRWADIPLRALVGRGIVEVDERGLYRLNPNAQIFE